MSRRVLEGSILGKRGHTRESVEGSILEKRGSGRPTKTCIKQTCRDVQMQNYWELKRAAGDRHQWRGIIRMLHDRTWG